MVRDELGSGQKSGFGSKPSGLETDFVAHPGSQSPVRADPDLARNGGKLGGNPKRTVILLSSQKIGVRLEQCDIALDTPGLMA